MAASSLFNEVRVVEGFFFVTIAVGPRSGCCSSVHTQIFSPKTRSLLF